MSSTTSATRVADKLSAGSFLAAALKAHHDAEATARALKEREERKRLNTRIATLHEALHRQFRIVPREGSIEIDRGEAVYPIADGIAMEPGWGDGPAEGFGLDGHVVLIARIACPHGCGGEETADCIDMESLGRRVALTICRTCHRPFIDALEGAR